MPFFSQEDFLKNLLKIFLKNIILLFFIYQQAGAFLDGLTSPLYVDTPYTLTDGEWCRGFIKFKQGFDLPPNGTAYIGVNQKIGGNIYLNNGTLIMTSDLSIGFNSKIIGPGFIKSNNYTLYPSGDFRCVGTVYFLDDISFNGLNNCVLQTTTADMLNMTKLTRVALRKMTISSIDPASFIFPASWLNSLILEDLHWEIGAGKTFSLTTSSLSIEGKSSFLCPQGTIKIPTTMTCKNNGSLFINYLTNLEIAGLALELSSANLELSFKTKLFFTKPTTWGGNGYCKINGQVLLESSGLTIFTNPQNSLAITPGSKLVLKNIHLGIA